MTRKRPSPDVENLDSQVWRKVVENVRPLTGDAVLPPPLPEEKPAPVIPPKKIPPPPVPAAPIPKPRLTPLSHGDVRPLDKRTGKRFTDGRLPIEARLDLHGRNEPQAHETLRRFIRAAFADGLRCVLVVTGKGRQSEGGVGIIRAAAPDWLNEPDLRPLILSFSHAQPKDGGAGALYVLLKRQRL